MDRIGKGESWIIDGQRYRCIGMVPHTRLDGVETTLAVVETKCATCGQPFTVKAPLTGANAMSRRCQKHKRPGTRVTKTERARLNG